MSRTHGAIQNALSTVTYLTELVKSCKDVGVDISAVVWLASSNVLWDQGEMTASIRMLRDLQELLDSPSQLIQVSKPELLARLVSIVLYPHFTLTNIFRDIGSRRPG